ncbi:glycosyltransferase family 47 protein [Termitidicoccus mucosus]|uniref:Exostosin GT47 domain-containing protein n=1 Tax=Termitidicoccus mucosus TaxID=1184151 RepID=A0A178IC76_9BACT|nr:hypothetical protein AW736_22180 [Opitutaceae bacterium TSB47]
MKIHVTSCETGPDAWRHQEELLRSLWPLSSRRHVLVESPDEADIIFVGNLRPENWYASLRSHPVVNRHPGKCFALSDAWQLLPLLHGIYTNAHKKLPARRRYRSGAYTLYHPDYKNPFIENHPGRAWEKPKLHLASFAGRDCHPVRAAIFRQTFARPDILVRDTSSYNAFTHDNTGKAPKQRDYVELLEASKFAICPRGSGGASIRLFESMRIGVAPVIISDDWIRPRGPDWSECALILRENEIHRLEALLVANEHRHAAIAQAAAEAYARHFAPAAYFDYLVDQALDIKKHQFIPESLHWRARHLVILLAKIKNRLRKK